MKTLTTLIAEKESELKNILFDDGENGIEHVDMGYTEFLAFFRTAMIETALAMERETKIERMTERNMMKLSNDVGAETVGETEMWNACLAEKSRLEKEFINCKRMEGR